MEHKRIFGKFGFNLPKTHKEAIKGKYVKAYDNWVYDPVQCDYVNVDTGQIMTNYIPDTDLDEILNDIDLKYLNHISYIVLPLKIIFNKLHDTPYTP